jgi:hypothetical protein
MYRSVIVSVVCPASSWIRLRRRTPHGEMRAECVPKYMAAHVPKPGALSREPDRRFDDSMRERATILLTEDALAPQVPVHAKRSGKPNGHRDLSFAPALR